MCISSKSPRKVALVALDTAKESLADYAHCNSPKTYTQPQLFACLVLKRFFKTDYRGIHAILHDMPALQQDLGLKRVPHFTTLQQASRKLLAAEPARDLLDRTVEYGLGQRRQVGYGAGDSTGLRCDRESRHYTRRRAQSSEKQGTNQKRRFPKATLLADCQTHLVLAMRTGRGPRPDTDELEPLLNELSPELSVRHLLLDAGYDSEMNHQLARDDHGMLTTIPPTAGRPSDKPPTGYYRRLMDQTIDSRDYYGQRWQIETVNSMVKRNQGDVVLGHTAWARRREMRLAILTHNIAITLIGEVLYRAGRTPFFLVQFLNASSASG